MRWLLCVLLACSGSPKAPEEQAEDGSATVVHHAVIPQGPPKGQKHPPIPADNPAWRDDRPGFRANHFFYGERSWDDVRMRIIGHLAAVQRDRARLAALSGDPARAGAIYTELAERLRAMALVEGGMAAGVRDRLVAAAARDGRLLRGVASGRIPEDLQQPDGGLASVRARLLHWSLATAHHPDKAETAAWVRARAAIRPRRATLQIDRFVDFDDRHQLRLRLLDAYLDVVDPIGFSDPWGYWEDHEITRQKDALLYAAEAIAPVRMPGKPQRQRVPDLGGKPRWQHASIIAMHIEGLEREAGFSVEGMGRLPTGDSLIDVGGEPGPLAIGKLERLGLDDEAHVAWLTTEVAALNRALTQAPHSVPDRVRQTVAALDAHGHGSRYYNIKAARNEAVRQLARQRHFDAAVEVLRDNRPLHHQDWACPNRAGILLALEGRLLARSGSDGAAAVLERARAAAEGFLAEIDKAEAAGG